MAIDTTTTTVTRNGVSAPLESPEGHGILEDAVRDALGLKGAQDELGAALEYMPYPIPETSQFVGTKGFLAANDLEMIATELIRQYPQHFDYLSLLTISWLWKGKANKRGWTKMAKDVLGYFADGIDVVVWLGADVLREEQFTHRQVRAQVFHELLHIVQDEKGKIIVRSDHDFEGYIEELEVFGPWTAELSRAKASFDAAAPASMGPLFDDLDDQEDLGVD